MKSLHRPLIAACLIFGLSGIAMAQATAPTDARTSAHPMAKMHASMQARHTQHLADLKSKLKLDAAQEGAWLNFTQAMQMPSPPTAHPDRIALEKLTTPERLDWMQAHKAQRDAQMLKRSDAAKSFYAVLNSEQKIIFDSETSRFMKRMGDRTHNTKHSGRAAGHHPDHHAGHH